MATISSDIFFCETQRDAQHSRSSNKALECWLEIAVSSLKASSSAKGLYWKEVIFCEATGVCAMIDVTAVLVIAGGVTTATWFGCCCGATTIA